MSNMPYFATNLVVEYFVENRGKYCVEIFCDNLLQKFPHIARNYILCQILPQNCYKLFLPKILLQCYVALFILPQNVGGKFMAMHSFSSSGFACSYLIK